MFPITLQRKDKSVATCQPPCYGFLRDAEWSDWHQCWHRNSWQVQFDTCVDEEDQDPDDIFEGDMCCYGCDLGDEKLPSDLFAYEDLYAIWNSGAELPYNGFHDNQLVAQQWMVGGVDYTLTAKRPQNTLEKWCEARHVQVTMKEVMYAFEAALDKGRESCLLWDENSGFMGVRTNVECDRALFYLMVNRELASWENADQMFTFLDEWYIGKVPIMLAFMATRLFAKFRHGFYKDQLGWVGGNHDSSILPAQNFWVGCGSRYAQPTAVMWQQHTYESGQGHFRDDDLDTLSMEPTIKGFGQVHECFNVSMFDSIFGGAFATGHGDTLYDRAGGERVKNLICEFYRTVAKQEVYREKGSGGYLSYWQADRGLHSRTESDYVIPHSEWLKVCYKLLMDD